MFGCRVICSVHRYLKFETQVGASYMAPLFLDLYIFWSSFFEEIVSFCFLSFFAEVSRHGRDDGNMDINMKLSNKPSKKALPTLGSSSSNEGASTSGLASQATAGVLSGSGVLNARPGSTTSSGLLSQMASSLNADVAREYLEKVADLLLEFSQANTLVKSYMCSQSLLARLFQMFNKMEPPILLKVSLTSPDGK